MAFLAAVLLLLWGGSCSRDRRPLEEQLRQALADGLRTCDVKGLRLRSIAAAESPLPSRNGTCAQLHPVPVRGTGLVIGR